MQSSCRQWFSFGVLAIAVVGCNDNDKPRSTRFILTKPRSGVELIIDDLRSHHFGPVVSKAGLKMKHAYRLVNTSSHNITIREVVNRKPCCGDVRVGNTVLQPGDETTIEVTLPIRQEVGDIIHETVVLTEPDQPEALVLRTMARAYPELRVEEATPVNGMVLLTSGRPQSVEFQVFAYGTRNDPLIELDCVELESTIKVEWLGAVEEASSENGLIVTSRRFSARLDPAGEPKEHKEFIAFRNGNKILHNHVVHWEAIAPVTASPKRLVMKTGTHEGRVLIRSWDQTKFRIVRIECNISGIQGRAVSERDALMHIVEVRGTNIVRSASEHNRLTVFTNHPLRETLDLSVVVVD